MKNTHNETRHVNKQNKVVVPTNDVGEPPRSPQKWFGQANSSRVPYVRTPYAVARVRPLGSPFWFLMQSRLESEILVSTVFASPERDCSRKRVNRDFVVPASKWSPLAGVQQTHRCLISNTCYCRRRCALSPDGGEQGGRKKVPGKGARLERPHRRAAAGAETAGAQVSEALNSSCSP